MKRIAHNNPVSVAQMELAKLRTTAPADGEADGATVTPAAGIVVAAAVRQVRLELPHALVPRAHQRDEPAGVDEAEDDDDPVKVVADGLQHRPRSSVSRVAGITLALSPARAALRDASLRSVTASHG